MQLTSTGGAHGRSGDQARGGEGASLTTLSTNTSKQTQKAESGLTNMRWMHLSDSEKDYVDVCVWTCMSKMRFIHYPLFNHILLFQGVLLTGCGRIYDLHAWYSKEKEMSGFRYLQTARILCHDNHMTCLVFIRKKTTGHWMEIKGRMKSAKQAATYAHALEWQGIIGRSAI